MVLGRQVLNEDGQSFMQAVELTEDHKPDNPVECRRINEAGGRVDRLVSGMGWQNEVQLWLPIHICPVACVSSAVLGTSGVRLCLATVAWSCLLFVA